MFQKACGHAKLCHSLSVLMISKTQRQAFAEGDRSYIRSQTRYQEITLIKLGDEKSMPAVGVSGPAFLQMLYWRDRLAALLASRVVICHTAQLGCGLCLSLFAAVLLTHHIPDN